LALNQGLDLGQKAGQWIDLPIEDGSYSLTMWGSAPRTVVLFGESNSYREVSPGFLTDVLVGSATTAEPYAKISSSDNCYTCHVDVDFHGGRRRGYETCVICHGTAGAADRPQYVAANAPDTTDVAVTFRSMLHKIHQGAELANASSYEVIGFGSGYPNNFSSHTYEHVNFPAFPAGTMECAKCHGTNNDAWIEPVARMHSDGQTTPTQAWTQACGSCHDSAAQLAHMDAQTGSSGVESCGVCHDPGKFGSVEVVHTVR
jgi:OmcA/MtrC family decaheme c-type cytochrome